MRRSLLAAAAAVSLALGAASSANALTTVQYNLTDDHCTGTCGGLSSYGTVDVTGSGESSTLTFAIDLANNVFFNPNGNGIDTFSFDLLNNPIISFGGVTSPFTETNPQSAGSNHEDGFGNWDYIVNLPMGSSTTLQHLSFTVTGSGANAGQILTIDHNTADNQSIFAAVDIIGTNTKTGAVGATFGSIITTTTGGVPEPASWALMIMGIGGIGASLRARRRTVAATA